MPATALVIRLYQVRCMHILQRLAICRLTTSIVLADRVAIFLLLSFNPLT